MDRRRFVVGAASLVLAPRAFAKARVPVVLVTADEESRLVVVDLAGGRVLRHVPTLASPRSIETVGETAVVAHSELGAVSLVRDTRVVHVLRDFGEPRYTAAHPDGRHAYVTDAARGEVAALDVVRGRVLARVRVGPRARHITISPDARTLWIARGSCAGSGRRSSHTTSAGHRTAATSGSARATGRSSPSTTHAPAVSSRVRTATGHPNTSRSQAGSRT